MSYADQMWKDAIKTARQIHEDMHAPKVVVREDHLEFALERLRTFENALRGISNLGASSPIEAAVNIAQFALRSSNPDVQPTEQAKEPPKANQAQ